MSRMFYFMGQVEVLGDKQLRRKISTLVSQRGVHKVFAESEAVHRAFLKARVFFVRIEDEIRRARLVREEGAEGVHYNLHLLKTEEDAVLGGYLQTKGIQSPWKREFPRISVAAVSGGTEKPARVLFARATGGAVGEVVNYSVHGMLFEFECSRVSMGEYIGQQVKFSLLTCHGHQLEVSAKVTRIYDEMLAPGRMVRGLGVKFEAWEARSQKRYHDLILEACRDMKKNFS